MADVGSTEAIWALWLVLIAGSFGVLEALMIHRKRPTLSWTVWAWSKAWPLLPFLAGLMAGGLAVHFWWLPQTAKGF